VKRWKRLGSAGLTGPNAPGAVRSARWSGDVNLLVSYTYNAIPKPGWRFVARPETEACLAHTVGAEHARPGSYAGDSLATTPSLDNGSAPRSFPCRRSRYRYMTGVMYRVRNWLTTRPPTTAKPEAAGRRRLHRNPARWQGTEQGGHRGHHDGRKRSRQPCRWPRRAPGPAAARQSRNRSS